MTLELAVFVGLAAACAPSVAPETLAAVARAESGLRPFAIGVNGPGGGPLYPPTREAAVALATDLIERGGRSVDLGLMQVNSANLRPLGLTVADAFEPCRNVAAGARVLREGYAAARRSEADTQRALHVALSRYNTGDPERGFANGYVTRVQGSAEVVVPAIRLRGEAAASARLVAPIPAPALMTPDDDPDAPPEWDVWAQAIHASRPRLLAVPRQVPATLGGVAKAVPTDPPRTAE